MNRPYLLPPLKDYDANRHKLYAVRQLRTAESVHSLWSYFLLFLQGEELLAENVDQHALQIVQASACRLTNSIDPKDNGIATSQTNFRNASKDLKCFQAAPENSCSYNRNVVTGRLRLPVFIGLSNSRE